MNIKNRIGKLESNLNRHQCFCGKAVFLNLWHGGGESRPQTLATCPNCKKQSDFWARISIDAMTSENLTDARDYEHSKQIEKNRTE